MSFSLHQESLFKYKTRVRRVSPSHTPCMSDIFGFVYAGMLDMCHSTPKQSSIKPHRKKKYLHPQGDKEDGQNHPLYHQP